MNCIVPQSLSSVALPFENKIPNLSVVYAMSLLGLIFGLSLKKRKSLILLFLINALFNRVKKL